MSKHYRNPNPRWLTARRPDHCSNGDCRAAIEPGDAAMWFPQSRAIYCEACGEQHDRDVAADDFDAAVLANAGGWI